MGKKYIYQMGGLTKKYGQREVLKDIWPSFYPNAKIGVLVNDLLKDSGDRCDGSKLDAISKPLQGRQMAVTEPGAEKGDLGWLATRPGRA